MGKHFKMNVLRSKKRTAHFSFKERKLLLALLKTIRFFNWTQADSCKFVNILRAETFEKLYFEHYSFCGESYCDGKTLKGKYKNSF